MDLLIALVVFIVGFMVFGSLIYGAARFFLGKHSDNMNLPDQSHRSINLRINKRHSTYSFK